MHAQAASKALEGSTAKASLKAAFTELMTADSTKVSFPVCLCCQLDCLRLPCPQKAEIYVSACSQAFSCWGTSVLRASSHCAAETAAPGLKTFGPTHTNSSSKAV